MSIGLDEERRTLARSLVQWATETDCASLAKASERAGTEAFAAVWKQLVDFGLTSIAVPEKLGGAGGTMVDLAVAVEACATGMVPGPVVPTVLAAQLLVTDGASELLGQIAAGEITVAVCLEPLDRSTELTALSGSWRPVWGLGTTTHALVAERDTWHLVDLARAGTTVEIAEPVDLSTRIGRLSLDQVMPVRSFRVDPARVHDLAAVLAAAEAAGIARYTLDTAVEYAKVREQFGRPIGSFQAVKHLCAEMLEIAESATAVAWDAATAHDDGRDQLGFAAAVAGAAGPEAAVTNAQHCIQVLGGIGFTWEHDAHLYLRRAMVLRQLTGGTDRWRRRLAELALSGRRRHPHVDLAGIDENRRMGLRALAAEVAEVEPEQRQAAFARTGLLMPHWPEPYGLGSDAVEQIVIDEELARAGLTRPDLAIGAWAAPTILEHGDDDQRERFVEPTLSGEIVWCQLFSEPGAGSDLASLRTRAVRVDGGWRLSGQKVWTSLAHRADWAICLARTNPDAPQHKGITYFLVDMRSEGLEIRPLREITGEAMFNEVFLDDVFVPDDCVVGEVDGGWPLARTTLANERVAMSGSSLGVSLELALETAARRGYDDATLSRLGAATATAGTSKALSVRSTMRSIAGHGPGPESSVQKLVGVRERQDASELAVELLEEEALLGGAEAREAIHEALLTRCLSIAGGTTQILRNVAAERILGLPRG